jgi:hypothetical protein
VLKIVAAKQTHHIVGCNMFFEKRKILKSSS